MGKIKSEVGRPVEMPHPWGSLANCVGGTFKLAEKLSISQPTLSRWSRGEGRINPIILKEVERLCKYYGIEFKHLESKK